MSVAPYPHIKMGVRDESIYVGLDTEVLPLDRPLYMARCRKGPIGKPVWCPTYTYACQIFGSDTFNKRSKFWSEASYFLLKTLVSNGAFIMRVADDSAVASKVFLECGIRKADVPQWQRNSITGQFILNDDGSRVKVAADGSLIGKIDGVEYGKITAEDFATMTDSEKGIYATCNDTKAVTGKTYYGRRYASYTYTPYTEEKASKNMVLWYGDDTPEYTKQTGLSAFETGVTYYTLESSTYTAVPSTVTTPATGTDYYTKKDFTPDTKEYATNELTDKMLAESYLFRKSTTADYLPASISEFIVAAGDIDSFETGKTYFTYDATAKKYTKAAAYEDSKTYYVFTPVAGSNGKIYLFDSSAYTEVSMTAATVVIEEAKVYSYQPTVDTLLPVTDLTNLDPAIKYTVVTFKKWVSKIFFKGDTIDLINTYYARTPNYGGSYEYYDISTVVTDFAAGDKIESDGSLFHKNTTTGTYSYVGNEGALYEKTGTLKVGDYVPQGTIPGYQLMWRRVLRSKAQLEAQPADSADPTQSNGFDWYPMMSFEADSAGSWGNAFGFRFYYDRGNNTVASVSSSGAIKFTLSPVELKDGDTTATAIVDAYGDSAVVGTIKDGVVDPTTDLEITMKKLLPSKYSGSRELPCSTILIPENFAKIGKMLMEAEINARQAIGAIYADMDFIPKNSDTMLPEPSIFTDDLLATIDDVESVEDAGYMANVVSCIAPDKVPYFASCVVGTFDEAAGVQNTVPSVIDMNADSAFYMLGGLDGDISDYAVESYQRKHIDACVAGTQDYLVDYLRCPYNNIIDTGVSLKTKKSYLDFMGVRDNLTVFLTPQQLWANQDGSYPAELSRYEDESVGAGLRSYGLLMREDVENQTEANRCCIFLASGINSDHDYANDGHCASTLWVALKNATYYNGTAIKNELGERPNSEVTCYDGGMTWTAANEETRSRCWNAGLNYAQYCEQTVIHYASVRSIYRYDTSVLCDIGTVRAVTFCKDIIRKEWAIWAGSKRKAEELNGKITQALNEKLAAMLNNKYAFSVKVYQTDEDKKYGYVRHVDLELTAPAQNRVWLATIICKREGFDPSAEG